MDHPDRYKPGEHRWSGWPGAYCIYCGSEDANEVALAEGMEPPFPDKNSPCSAPQEQRDKVDKFMNPDWFIK